MKRVRRLARQRALQLLYALQFAPPAADPVEVERLFLAAGQEYRKGWGPFPRNLARVAWADRAALDDKIRPLLHKWTLERLPLVERLCLRLALAELTHFPDIPLRVTINEYLDLVRQFSGDEAPAYVNAVLDRLAHEFPHKDFQVDKSGEGSAPEQASRDGVLEIE